MNINSLKIRLRRLRHGIYTPKEFLLFMADSICEKVLHKPSRLYVNEHVKRLLHPDNEAYNIKNVKLPLLDSDNERLLVSGVLDDTFYSYIFCDDKYDEEIFNKCDKFLTEGLYGLINSQVNVTVESGDIVIDAGSWIGDFAAYSSVRGATTYAFEPSSEIFKYLEQTARLNKNIIPIKKGLSTENTNAIFINSEDTSSGKFVNDSDSKIEDSSSVETVRLDDFVHENNLPRVDFIKSDIEGFERHMLAGAQGVLREFAPKLALCTYHLPDDPEVMAYLIKHANPKYNIVQKRMKLFASVPE